MRKTGGNGEKIIQLMQLYPPASSLNKEKPPEIYPHLYFDHALEDDQGANKAEEKKAEKLLNTGSNLKQSSGRKDDYVIPSDKTLLIEKTLRSGQKVRYPGHVVVMGDVNPGAEVLAGGNIIVFGSLRGIAHAGANGNTNAVVTAFRLSPTQLRIASYITRAPDEEEVSPQLPEIAYIKNGTVVIERYHSSWGR